MMFKNSKNVLITGAQGALGSWVVEKFLNEGWSVTGTYFPSFQETCQVCSEVEWLKVDLADPQSVRGAFSAHSFDALVHCAGGFRYAASDQISDADLDFLINTNLKSAFYLVREILPGMKQRNYGRIVFVSARATLQPAAGLSAYAASKAGLNMLTASLAEEVKSFDININAVLPSIIDTPANRRDMPHSDFSKWVSPEELAEVILTLTSPKGRPIHGALVPVSGRV